VKTAQTAASNWSASGPRASTAYQEGVNATTKDWASLATAAIPQMVQGFNTAAANGTISAGINARGTAGWKTNTLARVGNYTTGFTAGASDYAAAAQKFMPAIASGVAALPPRGDINANLQRANTLALYLHGLKGTLGAR
jgi:hypothetical protein